jgi:hypothetical protein
MWKCPVDAATQFPADGIIEIHGILDYAIALWLTFSVPSTTYKPTAELSYPLTSDLVVDQTAADFETLSSTSTGYLLWFGTRQKDFKLSPRNLLLAFEAVGQFS